MRILLVTAPEADAGRLASALVEKHLAACVNRVRGVHSTYRWKGKTETAAECLLIVKTRNDLVEAASRCIREHHPYEVPEILVLPVEGGNPDYIAWVEKTTARAPARPKAQRGRLTASKHCERRNPLAAADPRKPQMNTDKHGR